jgi:hypothetical protein
LEQNSLRTPGEDRYTLGSAPVKRQEAFGTPNHVVKGEEVARRQLSQWQWPRQSSGPLYSNVMRPHKQRPVFTSIGNLQGRFDPGGLLVPPPSRQHVVDQRLDLATLDTDVLQLTIAEAL